MTSADQNSRPGAAVSGWIEAGVYAFIVGLLSLVYAIGGRLGVHTIAFILHAMVFSSVAILLLAGWGRDGRAMMLHPLSWVVGGAIILVEVLYFLVLLYVPPAQGNILVRTSIPWAMIGGWALFARRPPRLAGIAAAVILLVIAYAIGLAPEAERAPLALCGVLCGLMMATRSFAAELHPWNRAARTVRDKLQVTGLLLFVTSTLSLALTGAAAAAIAAGAIAPTPFIPTLAQLTDPATVALGGLAGGALLTLMSYLGFSVAVKIGTENLLAMMAFTPLTSWFFQEVGVALGLIVAARPDARLVGAIAVIVASVFVILHAGRIARLRRG